MQNHPGSDFDNVSAGYLPTLGVVLQADTVTAASWHKAISGKWLTAGYWSPSGVPTAATAATIAAAGTYTVTISKGAVAQSLDINASGVTVLDTGSLALAGGLDVEAGSFDLYFGTLSGATIATSSAGTFLDDGGTLSNSLVQGTLDVAAGATSYLTAVGFSGAGGAGLATINILGVDGALDFIGSATLDNAIVNLGASDPGISGYIGGAIGGGSAGTTFTLGPNLVVDQAGQQAEITSGGVLVNDGTINADTAGGTLVFNGAGGDINTGTITVSNDDTIILIGAVDAALINSIVISGGTVDVFSNVTGGTLVSPTADIAVGGTLTGVTIDGTLTVLDGSEVTNSVAFAGIGGIGRGMLDIGMSGSSSGITVDGIASLDNVVVNLGYDGDMFLDGPSGVFTLGSDMLVNVASGDAVISSQGSLVNDGTISVTAARGGLSIYAQNFTNAGTIDVSGGGTLEMTGNSSSNFVAGVNVTDGTLQLDSAFIDTTAVTLQAGETLALEGGGTLDADISGAGTLLLNNSIGYTIASAISISATLALYGTEITLASGVNLNLEQGDTWIGDGSFSGPSDSSITIEGTLLGNASFGVKVLDTGKINVAAGGGVDFGSNTGSSAISGTLTGAGTAFVIGSAGLTIEHGATFDIDHVVQNGGPVVLGQSVARTLTAGQSWTLQNARLDGKAKAAFVNDGSFSSTGSGSSIVDLRFTNAGLINAGSGTLQFLGALVNTGTITAAGGHLIVGGSLSGHGALDIGAPSLGHGMPAITGIAELNGVTAGQTISFITAGSTLLLDAPSKALGHIADFAAGDTITLAGTQETGFSYANNILSVMDGSATAARLLFDGAYSQASFALADNSDGQVVITHT